jgi:hypothetical protein
MDNRPSHRAGLTLSVLLLAGLGIWLALAKEAPPESAVDTTSEQATEPGAPERLPAPSHVPTSGSGLQASPIEPHAERAKPPHAIQSVSELNARLDEGTVDEPETLAAVVILLDYCSDPRFPRSSALTPERIIAYTEEKGDTARANFMRQTLQRLCDDDMELPSGVLERLDSVGYDPFSSMTAAFIADRVVEDGAGADQPDSTSVTREALLDLFAAADGFYEYLAIGQVAQEHGLLPGILGELSGEAFSGLDEASSLAVVEMAACRIFGGCGATSLHAVTRCWSACESTMNVEDIIRDSTSPRQYRSAQRLTDRLVVDRMTRRRAMH